jgi:photosystem II stability/assembly factor-like uncharacterized protein
MIMTTPCLLRARSIRLLTAWCAGLVLAACGGGAETDLAVAGGPSPAPALVAPVITQQPASLTVAQGAAASFTVAATGSAPLAYQWTRSGAAIAGATAATYTLPATTTGDNGAQFAVVVSNAAGTVTSSIATLTVTAPATAPAITQQPANVTVVAGQTATFTVTATGSTPLAYQWQRNGTDIAGATNSSYTTSATVLGDSGAAFRVVVSNGVGSVTSSTATLTVTTQPVATAGLCHSLTSPFPINRPSFCNLLPKPFHDSVNRLYAVTDDVWVTLVDGSIVRTTDAGATWSVASTPASATAFADVHFINATLGLAAGTNANGDGVIYRSTDAGATWNAASMPVVSSVLAVRMIDANVAVAAAANQFLRSIDGGASWTLTSAVTGAWRAIANDGPTLIAVGTTNVAARSLDGGLNWQQSAAVGGQDITLGAAWVAVGPNGAIRRTGDGITWTSPVSGTTTFLRGVASSPNGNVMVAVGNAGTVLRSGNGGFDWTPVNVGFNDKVLSAVEFAPNGTRVVIAGETGTLLVSNDAGQSFTRVGAPSPTINDIVGIGANNGVVLAGGFAGALLRSTDDGHTWAAVTSGTGQQINAIAPVPMSTTWVAVADGGVIRRSTDNGVTWSSVTSGTTQDLVDVHFGTATAGVAVGDNGTVLVTSDGGATWAAAATGGFTGDLVSVRFGSPNVAIATGVGTLRTENGGASWSAIGGVIGDKVAWNGAQTVVVTSATSIQRSANLGQAGSWAAATVPVNANMTGQHLHFATQLVGRVLAQTPTGTRVLVTSDGGASWGIANYDVLPLRLASVLNSGAQAVQTAPNRLIFGYYNGTLLSVEFP